MRRRVMEVGLAWSTVALVRRTCAALMVKFEGRKRPARRGRIGRVEDSAPVWPKFVFPC